MSSTTLRMWESRHGFPRPDRLVSGHRRYPVATVEQVAGVLARRAAGLRLAAAITEATERSRPVSLSVFADLRRLHPHLSPHTMRKATLTALTHAMEDECCSRAERPWLFGAFQREAFYRSAESRWRDFARTAAGAWVLAEFEDAATSSEPVEVALPTDATLRREWVMVCLAEDLPCCVAAWELPGQQDVADGERLFEVVWTLDPRVVLDAARSCAAAASALGHDVAAVTNVLDGPGYPPSTELARAAALFSRVVAYVDGSRP